MQAGRNEVKKDTLKNHRDLHVFLQEERKHREESLACDRGIGRGGFTCKSLPAGTTAI